MYWIVAKLGVIIVVKLIITKSEVVVSTLKYHALITEYLCSNVSMETLYTSLTRECIQSVSKRQLSQKCQICVIYLGKNSIR